MQRDTTKWNIRGNHRIASIKNKLRHFVEKDIPGKKAEAEQVTTRPKDTINLSIGDPARYADFKVNPDLLPIAAKQVGKIDGYTDSQGDLKAREAVAKFYSTSVNKLHPEDVFLSTGGGGALHLAMAVLGGPDDNFLFSDSSFPLANQIAKLRGMEVRHFKLNPKKNWEVDLQSVEKQIDKNTKFIMVIDPSNPLGTVWSEAHKRQIIALCTKYRLTMIVDQIYETMTFKPSPPTFSELRGDLPIIKSSGLTKKWMVPGWRMGWLVVYGGPEMDQVRRGLRNIANVLLMPNTIIQAAIPEVLSNASNDSHLSSRMKLLEANQQALSKGLASESEYCNVSESGGAMYSVIKIDCHKLGYKDTFQISLDLFVHQNVLLFGGEMFCSEGFLRVVMCASKQAIQQLLVRFKRFCRARLSKSH